MEQVRTAVDEFRESIRLGKAKLQEEGTSPRASLNVLLKRLLLDNSADHVPTAVASLDVQLAQTVGLSELEAERASSIKQQLLSIRHEQQLDIHQAVRLLASRVQQPMLFEQAERQQPAQELLSEEHDVDSDDMSSIYRSHQEEAKSRQRYASPSLEFSATVLKKRYRECDENMAGRTLYKRPYFKDGQYGSREKRPLSTSNPLHWTKRKKLKVKETLEDLV
eukprot:GILK01005649.1.p1 GENE.GILK01005649.1~~GILK01005649.1.p1  ORF type:complete len:222 (+),score=34.19 GILK01005649.1:171-836(+)